MINDDHVVAALDLSRANKKYYKISDISLQSELKRIILLGKEIDLLETIRRQDNPNNDFFTFPKKNMLVYGSSIGFDPSLLEMITLNRLKN